MKLAKLIAFVGALNTLIHMRETCHKAGIENTFGPGSAARDMLRAARAVAQEAIVRTMAKDAEDAAELEGIANDALAIISGLTVALKALDADGSQKIAFILDAVA